MKTATKYFLVILTVYIVNVPFIKGEQDNTVKKTEQDSPVNSNNQNLIKNGDFESGVDVEECKHAAAWQFESDEAPEFWEFHNQAGVAKLVKEDSGASKKFLQIKCKEIKNVIIMQKIALKDAGKINITAKLRGNGEIGFYRLVYNKQTSKQLGCISCGGKKLTDSKEWVEFESSFDYDGKTTMYLALFINSPNGIDIDDVKVVYAPQVQAAAN